MYQTPRFNPKCTACSLNCSQAVPGQSEVPFNKVALIIVSSFPTYADTKRGLTLPAQPPEAGSKGLSPGEFLRTCLRAYFDRDPDFPDELKPFENYCYFTNALKGSPQKGRDRVTITTQMIRACKEKWLVPELSMFDPKVPILISSSEATKSLLGKDESLYGNRREVHEVGQHPAIVTFNFADVERGAMRDIPQIEEVKEDLAKLFRAIKIPGKKVSTLVKGRYWKPAPIGSLPWHFSKDMIDTKNLVKEFYIGKYGT